MICFVTSYNTSFECISKKVGWLVKEWVLGCHKDYKGCQSMDSNHHQQRGTERFWHLSVQLPSLSKGWESFSCCSLIFTRSLNSQSVCTKMFSLQTLINILQDVLGSQKGWFKKTKELSGAHHDRNIKYTLFFSWQVDWVLLFYKLVHFISWQVNVATVAS